MIDENLKQFATERQWEYYCATIKHGTQGKAAKALGVARPVISRAIKAIKKRAAANGYAPDHDLTHQTAPGFAVKRVSTNYNGEGEINQQWVIQEQEKAQQLAQLEESVERITDKISPLKSTKKPASTDEHLMTVYPIGDPHVGMYAWAQETGEDFDCDIARQDLFNAMSSLTSAAPRSKHGLVINLGDFFHADDPSNRTKRSGNELDVDTRWPRVLDLGILTMIDLIDLARKRHEEVTVINAIGNHDDNSSVMLSLCLKAWYRNEPRVTIRDTAAKHEYLKFGKVLIGVTHGDTVRGQQGRKNLAALMAADRPEDWGATTKRYWYTGHIHSSNSEELIGVKWESFRNLAPNDAWHQGAGYRSGRDLCAITHHKEHGEVFRSTCDISMVRE